MHRIRYIPFVFPDGGRDNFAILGCIIYKGIKLFSLATF